MTTATKIQQVVIADMRTRELAGKPDRFAYHLELHEFISTPPTPPPSIQPDVESRGQETANRLRDNMIENLGVLEVQLDGVDEATARSLAVMIEGRSDDGQPVSALITEQRNALFRAENLPSGNYTIRTVPR